MMMCHMVADSSAELRAMAVKIGVAAKWIQYPGVPGREHFDICKSKRALAVQFGAKEISWRDLPTVMEQNAKAQAYNDS